MTRPIAHPRDIDAARVAQRILDENPILREKIAAATGLKGAVEGANEGASVDEVLTEVVRFLQLIGTFGQTFTPSHPVDLAWHEFILCTKAYTDYCRDTFGRYVHHHPGGGDEENRSRFRKTLSSYRLCYGEPPARYWGTRGNESPDCGSCEGRKELG